VGEDPGDGLIAPVVLKIPVRNLQTWVDLSHTSHPKGMADSAVKRAQGVVRIRGRGGGGGGGVGDTTERL
jgi:hypothetical protein